MAHLVVITFDRADEAEKVRDSLRNLEDTGMLALDDSAVIVKDEKSKVHIKNQMDRGMKIGAAGGGLLGLLIAGIFFPFAGLIGGAIIGAVVGKMADLGVDQKFVHEVAASLKPDSSAIFILARAANPDAVVSALRPYKGTIYHTSLAPEAEEELRRILTERS
jgi:uncharacterized membrane protein